MTGRITRKTTIFQLRIDVLDIKPPVWRRVQVPGELTLGRLHDVVQGVFGWGDNHLHDFEIGGLTYTAPDPDSPEDARDEATTRLHRVAAGGATFRYIYDFGDNWRHLITVEKTLSPEPGVRYPRCIAGRRACPPEDVGGPWGYAEFLETLADPSHPEHQNAVDWIGDDFDPEELDLDEVDEAIERLGWRPVALPAR